MSLVSCVGDIDFNNIHFHLDINECHMNSLDQQHVEEYSHNCHADANCTNTKGYFYCTCHHGYSGDGVTCQGMKYAVDVTVCNFLFQCELFTNQILKLSF